MKQNANRSMEPDTSCNLTHLRFSRATLRSHPCIDCTSAARLPCASVTRDCCWFASSTCWSSGRNDYFYFLSKETTEELIFKSRSAVSPQHCPYRCSKICNWMGKSKSPVAQGVYYTECRGVFWPTLAFLHMENGRIFASKDLKQEMGDLGDEKYI